MAAHITSRPPRPPNAACQFDYLMRDSQYCGVKISCDFSRVMQFSKVCCAMLCYAVLCCAALRCVGGRWSLQRGRRCARALGARHTTRAHRCTPMAVHPPLLPPPLSVRCLWQVIGDEICFKYTEVCGAAGG